jgi:hypothetical protein
MKLIKLLIAAMVLATLVVFQGHTAQAATYVADKVASAAGAETCAGNSAGGNCVLACNASLRICSLFPSGGVPAGYKRVRHIPFGYRRVRQSVCDKLVCPDRSTTCRRWTPTGQNNKQ